MRRVWCFGIVPETEAAFWTGEESRRFCGGHIYSTKQPNTKILSNKSLGNVTAEALGCVRVDCSPGKVHTIHGADVDHRTVACFRQKHPRRRPQDGHGYQTRFAV